MCKHAYITEQRIYYDKGCRVIREYDTCIFCGHKTEERLSYMNDPPNRISDHIYHDLSMSFKLHHYSMARDINCQPIPGENRI